MYTDWYLIVAKSSAANPPVALDAVTQKFDIHFPHLSTPQTCKGRKGHSSCTSTAKELGFALPFHILTSPSFPPKNQRWTSVPFRAQDKVLELHRT